MEPVKNLIRIFGAHCGSFELDIIGQQFKLIARSIKKIKEFEEFGNLHYAPLERMHSIHSPWSFSC